MAAVLLMVGQRLEEPDVIQKMLDTDLHPCKPQYNYAPEVSDSCLLTGRHVLLAHLDVQLQAHSISCTNLIIGIHTCPETQAITLCECTQRDCLQEPLLFSRCVYSNVKLRVSDRGRAQTLQMLEQAADKHRIGSCIYMHAAENLKSDTYKVHDLLRNSKHSHGITSCPHMKLLKRITEPDISERLRIWTDEQSKQS